MTAPIGSEVMIMEHGRSGWIARCESPRIAVLAPSEQEARAAFEYAIAAWRELMARK